MSPLRHPLICFLALAFCVRALVPAGWMPVNEGGSLATLTLQLCPSANDLPDPAPQMAMDHATGGMDHPAHHGTDTEDAQPPCSFGTLASAAPLPEPPLIAVAAPVDDPIRIARFRVLLLQRPDRLQPPGHAPPATA